MSGQSSANIENTTNPERNLNLTLSDNEGTVRGTITVTNHRCFTSAKLTGTSVQASANNSGDNSLTSPQVSSNEGTASLSITTTETVDTTEATYTLSGTSKSLTRLCSGTSPGNGSGCRNCFQGTTAITLDEPKRRFIQ